jgi:23S rRNA maturation mini-RNase III
MPIGYMYLPQARKEVSVCMHIGYMYLPQARKEVSVCMPIGYMYLQQSRDQLEERRHFLLLLEFDLLARILSV